MVAGIHLKKVDMPMIRFNEILKCGWVCPHVRVLCSLTVVALLVAVAGADPFYLRYDPNETFPEQEGWSRSVHGPSSLIQRSIENGVFRLDTRASAEISDFYYIVDPAMNPMDGEMLRVAWRMRTLETESSWYDTDVSLQIRNAVPDEYVQFFFASDCIMEVGNGEPWSPQHLYEIIPGEFHDYVFISSDMDTYDLYVDGAAVFQGAFLPGSWFPGPAVTWGDSIRGLTSLSEWDYVEISILPEPSNLLIFTLIATYRMRCNERRIGS